MAQHIFTGSGAPGFAPTKVGQHYIDTLNQIPYVSTGTSSPTDWKANVATVESVFGRTGIVTAQTGDYTPAQVGADPAGTGASEVATHVGQSDPHTQYVLESMIGAPSGVAPLDSGSKIPSAYLPSFVDDVLEFANLASFPVTGETGKIYTDLATSKIYRWSGSVYVEISASPGSTDAVPEGATNLYFTAARVLAVLLTGFTVGANAAIAATDSILAAFGKVQGQLNALFGRNINAGTGLTGGGNLTADRTISLANLGTAGSYGSASQVPVITTDAQGRVSGVVSTAISILAAAVSNFASAVLAVPLTGITFPFDNAGVLATDSILVAIGKLQGQIDVWTELIKTSASQTNSSNATLVNVTDLGFSVQAGFKYYIEMTIVFQTVNGNTGFALALGSPNGATGTIAAQVNLPVAGDGTAALYTGSISSLGDVVTGSGVPAANVNHIANIKGVFDCANAGTILPQFRSEINGSQVTFGINSIALIREFA